MNVANFLREDNGNESNMRLLVSFVVVTLMGVWAYVSVMNKTLQPMQWEQVGTVLGALIAKGWQKGKENATATPS